MIFKILYVETEDKLGKARFTFSCLVPNSKKNHSSSLSLHPRTGHPDACCAVCYFRIADCRCPKGPPSKGCTSKERSPNTLTNKQQALRAATIVSRWHLVDRNRIGCRSSGSLPTRAAHLPTRRPRHIVDLHPSMGCRLPNLEAPSAIPALCHLLPRPIVLLMCLGTMAPLLRQEQIRAHQKVRRPDATLLAVEKKIQASVHMS